MAAHDRVAPSYYSFGLPELQEVTGQIIVNHKRVKQKNLSLNPTPYHHSSTYIQTTPQAPQIQYLKVWQGYGGNIYFEPLRIFKVGFHLPPERLAKSTVKKSDEKSARRNGFQEIPSSSSSSKFPRLLGSVRQLSIISTRKPFLSAGKPKLSDDFTWITSNTYSSRRAAL